MLPNLWRFCHIGPQIPSKLQMSGGLGSDPDRIVRVLLLAAGATRVAYGVATIHGDNKMMKSLAKGRRNRGADGRGGSGGPGGRPSDQERGAGAGVRAAALHLDRVLYRSERRRHLAAAAAVNATLFVPNAVAGGFLTLFPGRSRIAKRRIHRRRPGRLQLADRRVRARRRNRLRRDDPEQVVQ